MRSVNRSSKSLPRSSRARVSRAAQPALESLETRRLLAFAGDPDLAFNGTGWNDVPVAGEALGWAVAVEPGVGPNTDKVIVAGEHSDGHLIVARFLNDGSPDTDFGTGGVFTVSVDDADVANDVTVFGGFIYVAGTFRDTDLGGDSGVFVLRLDSAGVLDSNFSGDGIAIADDLLDQTGMEMTIDQDNGDVYVVGESVGNALVVKFDTDGVFDTTFGNVGDDGFATNNVGPNTVMNGIALQADKKIIIGGNSNGVGVLARLNNDPNAINSPGGTLNTSYSGGGDGVAKAAVELTAGITINNLSIGAFDNVYVVGNDTGAPVAVIQVIDDTGQLFDSFDFDGVAELDQQIDGLDFTAEGITLDGTTSVVISGFVVDNVNSTVEAFVARFDQGSGALDADFGTNGVGRQAADGLAEAFEVAVDGDGKIVTGGTRIDPDTSDVRLVVTRFLSVDDAPPPSPVFVDLDGNLVVPGTNGNDTFILTAVGSDVQVQYNGDDAGTFTFCGSILVTGLDGNDVITLDSAITARAEISGGIGDDTITGASGDDFLDGGAGNDSLTGGVGTDILLGGLDNDTLLGNDGRDVLIGGMGADSILGGAGQDLLIAAATNYDGSEASLEAILSVWDLSLPYFLRVLVLRVVALNPANLFDDGVVDTLLGGAGQDWFILDRIQDINDQGAGEIETNV